MLTDRAGGKTKTMILHDVMPRGSVIRYVPWNGFFVNGSFGMKERIT